MSFRAPLFLILSPLLTIGCTGGDRTYGERICGAFADCLPATPEELGQCESDLDEALTNAPQRALQECLDCLENETCSAVELGFCGDVCDNLIDSVDDPPDPTSDGTITVSVDGVELCGLDTWSPVTARSTGENVQVSARCGDISVDFQVAAVGVGFPRTCHELSVSASNGIFCSSGSATFTGETRVNDIDGTLRLQGGCNCFDDLDGIARVTVDIPVL